MNDETLFTEFVKYRKKELNKESLLNKYNMNEAQFINKRKELVYKFKFDPRFIFFKEELDDDMLNYCSSENLSKSFYDILEEIKKHDKQKIQKETYDELFMTTRKSSYVDEDGNIIRQWVREEVNKDKLKEATIKAVEKLCSKIEPVKSIELSDKFSQSKDKENYAVFLPLADMHIGVKIEKSRTKSKVNWGIKEAKEAFTKSIEYILNTAPAASELIIADLGDILHMADNTHTTPKSGHHLDSDCSLETSMDTMFELLYTLVDTALTKYEKIYIYSTPGNHNMDVSYIIKEVLRQRYRNMPERVSVPADQGHQNIFYHSFGKNLLAFTHGDEIKSNRIETVVWSDNAERISNYKNFDAYMGHYHQDKHVARGMVYVRVIKNFSPNDKWADSMGFRNLKYPGFMQAFIYHKTQGVISNIMYNPVIE